MRTIIWNRTKIIATVGPGSSSLERLEELVNSGIDCFRLNFSHGSHEDHQEVIDRVRSINKRLGTNICLLQDLQGPKIRTRDVENGSVPVVAGQEIIITTEKMVGTSEKISTTYKSLATDVKPGDLILIDDGKLELKVLSSEGSDVKCRVVHGGEIKSKKGINLPFSKVSAPSLTPKDEEDLEFGIKSEVDWIALSFVRKAQDIISLREKIEKSGKHIKIVAKIEKPEALENIDEIIALSDAIMVARGDLGVEVKMEDVPMIQKMIVEKCNQTHTPVIIATQMMESMIDNPRPTRAETNDIANAVLDGADALMLSAETAVGKYPIHSVQSMVRTIASVEDQSENLYYKYPKLDVKSPTFLSDSLVASACKLSKETSAKAIVGMTFTGTTASLISSHRPKAHIFIFTGNRSLLRTLSLVWGCRGFYYDKMVSTDHTFKDIEDMLKEQNHIVKGDIIVNTASMPIMEKNRTNMVKVKVVD